MFIATSSEIYKPQVLFMFDKFSIWNLSWQGVVVVVHRRNRMISNIINNSSELFAHFPLRPSVEWNFIAGRMTSSIQKQTQKPSNMLLIPATGKQTKQQTNKQLQLQSIAPSAAWMRDWIAAHMRWTHLLSEGLGASRTICFPMGFPHPDPPRILPLHTYPPPPLDATPTLWPLLADQCGNWNSNIESGFIFL